MYYDEFVMLLALHYKATHQNTNVAFVADYHTGIIASGVSSTINPRHTAIANVLSGIGSVEDTFNKTIYTTSQPTQFCIGMACMRKARKIIFPYGSTLKQIPLNGLDGSSPTENYVGYGNRSITHSLNNPTKDALKMRRYLDFKNAVWSKQQQKTIISDNAIDWSYNNVSTWIGAWKQNAATHADMLTTNAEDTLVSYNGISLANPYSSCQNFLNVSTKLNTGFTHAQASKVAPFIEQSLRDKLFFSILMTIVSMAITSKSYDNDVFGKKKPNNRPGGHNVGAILVDPQNRIVGWGLNIISENGIYHAETAMILSYLRRHNVAKLPQNCRLYTTLEPCHMCAGIINDVADNLKVYIAQKDVSINNNSLGVGIPGMAVIYGKYDVPKSCVVHGAKSAKLDDVFDQLFYDSGAISAIDFLYSAKARDFFWHVSKYFGNMHQFIQNLERIGPWKITGSGEKPESNVYDHLDLALNENSRQKIKNLTALNKSKGMENNIPEIPEKTFYDVSFTQANINDLKTARNNSILPTLEIDYNSDYFSSKRTGFKNIKKDTTFQTRMNSLDLAFSNQFLKVLDNPKRLSNLSKKGTGPTDFVTVLYNAYALIQALRTAHIVY